MSFVTDAGAVLRTIQIFINDIQINAHLFSPDEIENDIDPIQIKSIENHNNLVKYMSGISKVLNKKVVLTPENLPKVFLIEIDKDDIRIV